MLFDLEDYTYARIIGTNSLPADQISWVGPYTTTRATRDAYLKSVNEYVLAAGACSSAAEKRALESKYFEFLDALRALGPAMRQFWNAMVSLPLKASGRFEEGDGFYIMEEGSEFTNINYNWPSGSEHLVEYPKWYQNEYYQNFRALAFPATHGDAFLQSIVDDYSYAVGSLYTYTALTQEIYDDYEASMKAMQLIAKEIMLMGEGRTSFEEYVTPEIPAWDGYPELSGYVRGTNSMAIVGATVRLVDADGEVFEKVTDEKGYYKFDKELFYTSIALGTASTVDIFLKPTIGSASLYDAENIFQNSFFGAENDRSFTWPVSIKMGKPARRNIKIEFLPDYSNYPSFSGYVKDAAGNPIKDAFVQIKDSFTGYSIGEYLKPNGDIAMNFKYNDFGVDRTVLTDENGFYEYTSQMVGEWFNKQMMRIGDTPGKLGGRTFDEYFGSREDLINFYDSFSGRNLQYKESFFALLIPYKQNADSGEISWDGQPLYDQNDYYASRFKYALNPYGEFQFQRIDLNAHYDIDVDVAVAANDEVRADKFTVELLTERKNLESGLSSQTYVNTTSGYFKVVYPATGESYVANSGNWYYSHQHVNIYYSNADDYKDFYIYSCDSQGRAMGYIKEINSPSFTKALDLSGVKYLRVFNPINFYGESIDFSGLEYLEEISLTNSSSLKNVIGLESKKANSLYLFKLSALENIDISGLTGLTQLMLEYLPALQSLDVQSNTKLTYLASSFADIALDVSGLTSLNNITFNKLTMTSDDVDDLLNQLASMAPDQEGNNISYGNIYIDRISRSSYSDDAYATLSQRGWNINLGGYFYDEEIIPNKLIIEVDPSLASSTEWMDMNAPSIGTTTGYWIGKLWNGQLIGNVGIANGNTNISVELRLGTTDARVEIFSCNEYGVPAGEITLIQLNHPKIKGVDTSELSELEHFDIYYYSGSGSPYSTIGSLDFTQNHNLRLVNISGSNVESIDLTGLVSLENLTLSYCPNLDQITGFSSLSSLKSFGIDRTPSLGYASLAGLENLTGVYINEADLYDSTHVDTMLAELRTSVETAVASIDSQLYIKHEELDANQADWNLLMADLQSLYGELNQLVSDGAPQSSIDAKQSEIDAKEILNNSFYEQSQIIGAAISSLGTDRESHFGGTFNTNYMARTSASDADYTSLLEEYAWNLNIGSEFIAPYTAPVKGFVTFDWTPDQNGSSLYMQESGLKISTTTGYIKYVSSYGSGFKSVASDHTNLGGLNEYIGKGILEFWSCDSHGRPAGSISGFGYGWYNSGYMKSFDISNLTEIKTIYFQDGPVMSSIDLSSNTNIESISITTAYQLQSIVGFANLVNLKDIYISSCPILDLPVDFTSMPNLQRMYLTDLGGINKNSRLNVSGLTKLQEMYISWTNLISVDLDNALIALDAAGLNSESDFGYEGHLTWLGSNLVLNFGMGISRHAIADSAYASLQSKGWQLTTGDQIIDSIEDPTKAIVRWDADTEWAALSFGFVNGSGSVMAKLPDGTIQNVGSMISYNFDSSVPATDRFVEFWAVDSYGRPNRSISGVADWWNTGITSLEVKNMTNLGEININNSKIQSLDVSGMPNLANVYLNGSEYLESVILAGCSKISWLEFDSCPNLDIEQLLQDLDNVVSVSTNTKRLLAPSSVVTSAVEDEIESLIGKGWGIRVSEPASAPVIFNVAGGNVGFEVGTSTGFVKVIFATGSEMHQNYPDGWIQSHGYGGWAFSLDSIAASYYSWDANNFTGQISIISVGYNQADGSYFDSGKVRFLRNYSNGSFDYSTADSLKVAVIMDPTQADITSIGDLNLEKLALQNVSDSLNLSNSFAKFIDIDGGSLNGILFNNNTIKKLRMYGVSGLNSIDLAGATMSEIELQATDIENIELPADLRALSINSNSTWSGDLDLSGLESLVSLQLQETPLISSLDVTGLSNLKTINLYKVNCPIIGLETTSVEQLTHSGLTMTNCEIALPATITNVNISSDGVQSLILTAATGSTFKDGGISIGDYNSYYNNSPISTLVVPNNMKYYNFSRLSLVPDISSLSPLAEVTFQHPKVSTIDLQDIELVLLNIIEEHSPNQQYLETLNLSGSVNQLRLDTIGYYGYSWSTPGRGLSGDISNLTCTTLSVNNVYAFGTSLSIHPNTAVSIYGGRGGVNLSGKTLKSVNINWLAGGAINLSNANISNNVYLSYCSYVTSMNFDGLNALNLNISYCSAGNEYWYNYSGPNSFEVSLVSAVISDLNINSNRMLSVINATDASIRYYSMSDCFGLTSLTTSLKGTYDFVFGIRSAISFITLTDAGLSTLLNYMNIYSNNGISLSASIVDSVINAVSETNRTGRTLRLKNMSVRTSASQTAFDKLLGQSWNLVNL